MPTARKRAMLGSSTTGASKPTWARVKASLDTMDRVGLIALIHDLYEIDDLNRRVLHERFVPNGATFQRYRGLVRAAVFPDPLSNRPIRRRRQFASTRGPLAI